MSSQPSTLKATLVGALSPLMWATHVTAVLLIDDVPGFQLASLMFAFSFMTSYVIWRANHIDMIQAFQQPFTYWALALIGIFAFNTLYILAYQYAPTANVYFIFACWPLLMVGISVFMHDVKLTIRHYIAFILAMTGIFVIAQYRGLTDFKEEHIIGYLCIILATICWASYSALKRKYQAMPTYMVGSVAAVSSILCFILHMMFEADTVTLNLKQGLLIAYLGIFPAGLAYYSWSYGMHYGDIPKLALFCYGGMLLALGLMLFTGFIEPSIHLTIATICIILATIIGNSSRS